MRHLLNEIQKGANVDDFDKLRPVPGERLLWMLPDVVGLQNNELCSAHSEPKIPVALSGVKPTPKSEA